MSHGDVLGRQRRPPLLTLTCDGHRREPGRTSWFFGRCRKAIPPASAAIVAVGGGSRRGHLFSLVSALFADEARRPQASTDEHAEVVRWPRPITRSRAAPKGVVS